MRKSKIFTLILAVAMMLTTTLPMTAFAAGGSIQITPSGVASVESQVFKAYQIFTVETNENADSFVYELNPEYQGFETYYAAILDDLTLKEYILSLVDSTGVLIPEKKGALEDLARALWNWSKDSDNGITPETATGDDKGVSFENLEAGYYIVAGESLFSGSSATTFAALCTVLDNDHPTNVTFKADAPTIEKKVMNHHSTDWENWTDVSITDKVQFKLTSTIPDTTYYEQYTYKVHDRMSVGLSFDDIVSVFAYKGEASTVLSPVNNASDDGYQLSETTTDVENGDTIFTVTINSDTIKSLSEDGYDRIEIIYSAILNEDSVIESVGNPNYVYLEYSNDPNWVWDGSSEDKEPTEKTPEDDAWVYTYKLDIFKYTGTDTPLEGVEFQLFDDDKVAAFIINNNSEYVFQGFIPKQTEPDAAYLAKTVLKTDADGMIYIVGIDEGNYTLSEYQALPGYNAAEDITVTVYNKLLDETDITGINALVEYLNENCGKTNTGDSLVNYATYTKVDRVNVYNGKGSTFPGTGGIGVYIFYAVSAILTVGLIAFFVIRRRRNILKV